MKKNFYVVATVALMLLVSFLVHVTIATYRLGYFHPVPTTNYRHLLPMQAWLSVVAIGVVAGCYVAERWWHIVYEQKRHWSWTSKWYG